MSKGRTPTVIAEKRKAEVTAAAYAGHPFKCIAVDLGISEERVRGILWKQGWRFLHLSPEEQAQIQKLRKVAA